MINIVRIVNQSGKQRLRVIRGARVGFGGCVGSMDLLSLYTENQKHTEALKKWRARWVSCALRDCPNSASGESRSVLLLLKLNGVRCRRPSKGSTIPC